MRVLCDDMNMSDMNALLEPGMVVRNPARPEWGLGQVQSNIPGRVTVMFENAGKQALDPRHVFLEIETDKMNSPNTL